MRHRGLSCSVVLSVLGAVAAVSAPLGPADAVIPLKNAAIIENIHNGYRYQAGQQNSHLVVRRVKGGLLFADKGTAELRSLPGRCDRRHAKKGIAAVCRVPRGTSSRHPLMLQIWPRLGDDYVDASTLPASFRLSVLADAGKDVVRGGAGDDFVNGAHNGDRVWGGAGNDWIRTGRGPDFIRGGSGNDRLVGVEGSDDVRGGGGNDRVGGGSGNDLLVAGAGRDTVSCGSGADHARVDRADRTSACESVRRR